MNNEDCPRTVALSALIDDELAPAPRQAVLEHAARCPLCGTELAELRALHADFATLPEPAPGADLAGLIETRLRVEARPRPSPRPSPRPRLRDRLFPLGLRGLLMPAAGAAAALVLGLQLGNLLLMPSTDEARPPRFVAMAVFEPIAPGGLCPPAGACFQPGGAR